MSLLAAACVDRSPTPETPHVTSVERPRSGEDGAVSRRPVRLEVRRDGEWRISAYESAARPSPPRSESAQSRPESAQSPANSARSPAAAADVLGRYYAAIGARDFRRAYESWGDDGAASGQTYEQFAGVFTGIARVEAEIGEPGRVEPAAGSRYIEIPVVVLAWTESGDEQRFEGTYTLRRAVVDGASAEMRRWHIYSADVDRVR